MIDTKAIILAVFGVVAAMCLLIGTKEPFWNLPSRTWKVEKVLGVPSESGCGNDFFQTPNFQSLLAPRFSNVNYGPSLRTKLPSYNATAVPEDPLNKECQPQQPRLTLLPKYKTEEMLDKCSTAPTFAAQKCDGDQSLYGRPYTTNVNGTLLYGNPVNPRNGDLSYANGNYKQVVDEISKCTGGPVPTDTVVEGTGLLMGVDGEMVNPIVYDRYTVANRNSRLRAHGDKIRGDLPIAPNSGNWFTPNVHPNIDLEAGAINVLAGVNNDTGKQMANLIYNSSGRACTAIGGIDMSSYNPTSQYSASGCAGGGDLLISGFP